MVSTIFPTISAEFPCSPHLIRPIAGSKRRKISSNGKLKLATLVRDFQVGTTTAETISLILDAIKLLSFWLLLFESCDSNIIRTHNHLVCKRTLNHLAKWLSVRLRTKCLWVRIPLLPLKLQIWRQFRARSFFTFRQI